MWNNLKRFFQNYKHRSVPWLIYNWKNRKIKQAKLLPNSLPNENAKAIHLSRLQHYLTQLLNKSSLLSACSVLKSEFGFVIEKKRSQLQDGGFGVFVTDGLVNVGDLVALYPGTVYFPMEPIFFQSIANSYILRCVDGILIDGRHNGLSGLIFKSCATRDMIGGKALCDTSWLSDELVNPLCIGQYVNNENGEFKANVAYLELDIPFSFGVDLMKFIPNIHYNPPQYLSDIEANQNTFIRVVILEAVRPISAGEELFSTYMTEVYTG